MFKISEFSKLVRVSARMLRYYDKCGLLHPEETDKFTGYRLYSASQIPLMNKIVALRDMGFGVEEILQILPDYGNAAIMEKWLSQKSAQIHDTITNEHDKLNRIAVMRDSLLKECANMIYDVELKSLEAVNVLSLTEVLPSYDKEYSLWEKLGDFVSKHNIIPNAGGYSIYPDDEYKESDVTVEIAIPVSKLGKNQGDFIYKTLPAIPTAATIRYSGPYEGTTAAMEKLALWIEENGYAIDGVSRGQSIASPADVKSPEDYLTELQMPVRKL